MSVRMRHTKSHTANRRSHHGLKSPRLSKCSNCGQAHLRHRMCENCGNYKGKEIIDITAKIAKKQQKAKNSEMKAKEEIKDPEADKNSPLNAEKLSR